MFVARGLELSCQWYFSSCIAGTRWDSSVKYLGDGVNNRQRCRVAVTGMGVISPIGNSVEAFWEGLRAGRSGAGPITLFDPASLPTRIAMEVKWDGPIRRDRKISFALEAARQAYLAATACGTTPSGTGGLSLGLGLELFSMPDMLAYLQSGGRIPESRSERMSFVQTPSDLCAHLLSRQFNLSEPPHVHVSACAAGTDAIGTAFRLIASGQRNWLLAGGSDSMINPLGVAGFCRIQAMTTANVEPERASRPFDRQRSGFVLGEGAGMLLLEPLELANERGATVHAEIVGYGSALDAYGISEPHPEGQGAFLAMWRALEAAGVNAAEVDCINAHGTATPKNDPIETLAIKRLLGKHAYQVPICATKSMIGHLISAAGAVEAITAIRCMQEGWVHPTINLEDPDPDCDLDYVPLAGRLHRQQYVLSNSFGFGGMNASLLMKAINA
ncbi:MAG: beta-ketoacyl-[acyl-carrier-protein] synthase family protein [Cyanobacteria bacterium NC_groundwater_1444_Ag_S-0.65um_54_12]|nr:beta-ketoacyl-[acyl-carrier-protein] synthase family protein [Cyanobacteria bacterium NC_groundwater_1444_Ag_S-0.65um_54_12]